MDARPHRVSQGGLFHSHKVQYSRQTQDLIHRLIEESKLSILQRQELKESVRKGEPLPGPSVRSRSESTLRRDEVVVPPSLPRRRSYQAIVKSGAYQREPFDPPFNTRIKDREVEKQKLQSLMTYGKEVPPDSFDSKSKLQLIQKQEENDLDKDTLFNHLVQEIKERLEFLQEMESLGEAQAYQTVIEQEIATKMRQMAKIDRAKFLQLGISLDRIGSATKTSGKAKSTVSFENNIFPTEYIK